MGIRTLTSLLFWILVVALFGRFSTVHSDEHPAVEILVERIERVSRGNVHFWLKVTNKSERPVFLTGINDELGSRLYPVYLEKWRTKEGWKTVAPCMDTPPPHVIKLNPAGAMSLDLVLELPLSAVCKERNIQLEGRFRYRVEYFESEKQARAYVNKLFSRRWQEARAPLTLAFSEPFEIPSTSNPDAHRRPKT